MWECSTNGWGLQSDLALVFDVPRNTGYVGFFKKQILARADGLPKSDRKIASEPDLFEGELVMSWQSFIRYSRLIDICTHNAEGRRHPALLLVVYVDHETISGQPHLCLWPF